MIRDNVHKINDEILKFYVKTSSSVSRLKARKASMDLQTIVIMISLTALGLIILFNIFKDGAAKWKTSFMNLVSSD